MKVANNTPNDREVAMGMRNLAWRLFSSRMGKTPTKVVTEVSRMGRNRTIPPRITASLSGTPFQAQFVDVMHQDQGVVYHHPGKGDDTQE